MDPVCSKIKIPPNEVFALQYVDRFVRPDWCCVDVGAGDGDPYAHYFLHRLGPHGSVYAFEPGPLHSQLVKVVECRPDTERPYFWASKMALTSAEDIGQRRMQYYQFWTLLPEGDPRRGSCKTKVDPFEVSFTTLDRYGLSPHFIKLDVDGYEYRVLRGAEETLRRCRPLMVIELAAFTLEHIEEDLVDMLQYLVELDYEFVFPQGCYTSARTAATATHGDSITIVARAKEVK